MPTFGDLTQNNQMYTFSFTSPTMTHIQSAKISFYY